MAFIEAGVFADIEQVKQSIIWLDNDFMLIVKLKSS